MNHRAGPCWALCLLLAAGGCARMCGDEAFPVRGAMTPLQPTEAVAEPEATAGKPVDPEEAKRELEESARTTVWAGFADPDDIIEFLGDIYAQELGDGAEPLARAAVKRAVAEHLAAQATWPEVTEADRLTLAFNRLEEKGIIARQDYSDCQTCGVAEIIDDATVLIAQGKKLRGYVFFHDQDTEGLSEGSLMLSYGSLRHGDDHSLRIGDAVAEELKAAGFKVSWPRDIGARIGIMDLKWRKRRNADGTAIR